MKKLDQHTLEEVVRAIEGAYHKRKDYPPFALDPFTDRATYHQFIVKVIEELV